MHAGDTADRGGVHERHARQVEAQESTTHRDMRVEYGPQQRAGGQIDLPARFDERAVFVEAHGLDDQVRSGSFQAGLGSRRGSHAFGAFRRGRSDKSGVWCVDHTGQRTNSL
jgi:hypothetical protein